jgi:trimethylamine monooxygenase
LVCKRCNYEKIKVPNNSDVEKDINKWVSMEEKLENPDQMIDFQTEYTKELHSLSDYPKIDFELIRKILKNGNIIKLKIL